MARARTKHHHIMKEFLGTQHICSSCRDGDCNGCTGSARMANETHPLGIGSSVPCPSFTVCECEFCHPMEAV